MKSREQRPTAPLSKYTVNDAMDRATSHLVRADHQFGIPGPRQKDHWEAALNHLRTSRGALEEAIGVLETILVAIYGPGAGRPG